MSENKTLIVEEYDGHPIIDIGDRIRSEVGEKISEEIEKDAYERMEKLSKVFEENNNAVRQGQTVESVINEDIKNDYGNKMRENVDSYINANIYRDYFYNPTLSNKKTMKSFLKENLLGVNTNFNKKSIVLNQVINTIGLTATGLLVDKYIKNTVNSKSSKEMLKNVLISTGINFSKNILFSHNISSINEMLNSDIYNSVANKDGNLNKNKIIKNVSDRILSKAIRETVIDSVLVPVTTKYTKDIVSSKISDERVSKLFNPLYEHVGISLGKITNMFVNHTIKENEIKDPEKIIGETIERVSYVTSNSISNLVEISVSSFNAVKNTKTLSSIYKNGLKTDTMIAEDKVTPVDNVVKTTKEKTNTKTKNK